MTLYLKYRPQNFESLVGQEFVKNTLTQGIIQDKLVWAYLFTWPRGTGKTSTARIFAKTINCLKQTNGIACLECEVCRAFTDDSLVDIIEIDAASHTGVDNIREIIETAIFSPTFCKYKVYIIDEVHMLSKGAFNALLKILEEPPKHLKFILATTEIHKIPETILSRCQRYDFQPISADDIKNRLLYIAKNETITVDDESLDFIVKQSWGWLRNAISLFEQLSAGGVISFENVIQTYGIPKDEIIVNFYTQLLERNALVIWEYETIAQTYNLSLFFKEILYFIKEKMIQEYWNDTKHTHRQIEILDTIEEAFLKSKTSLDPKITFLVAIFKIISWYKGTTQETSQKKEALLPPTKKSISTPPLQEEKKKKSDHTNDIVSEITPEDIFDIFEETPLVSEGSPPKIKEKNLDFSLDTYIQELKKLWAKWALTMSLRSSSFDISDTQFTIRTTTKMAFKQLSLSESQSLLVQALESIWHTTLSLSVK